MESYGLMLAGGGAKGIYQIGAWKALRELEVPLQRVVGTSVGAMNGALVVLDGIRRRCGSVEKHEHRKGIPAPRTAAGAGQPVQPAQRGYPGQGAVAASRAGYLPPAAEAGGTGGRTPYPAFSQGFRPGNPGTSGRQGRFLYKDQIPVGRMMDYIMASAAYPGLKRPGNRRQKVPGRRVGGQRAGAYAALPAEGQRHRGEYRGHQPGP